MRRESYGMTPAEREEMNDLCKRIADEKGPRNY